MDEIGKQLYCVRSLRPDKTNAVCSLPYMNPSSQCFPCDCVHVKARNPEMGKRSGYPGAAEDRENESNEEEFGGWRSFNREGVGKYGKLGCSKQN